VPNTLPDFNQIWGYSTDFHEVRNIKFQGNSFIWSRVCTCIDKSGRTDRDTERRARQKPTGAFRDGANTPRNVKDSIRDLFKYHSNIFLNKLNENSNKVDSWYLRRQLIDGALEKEAELMNVTQVFLLVSCRNRVPNGFTILPLITASTKNVYTWHILISLF